MKFNYYNKTLILGTRLIYKFYYCHMYLLTMKRCVWLNTYSKLVHIAFSKNLKYFKIFSDSIQDPEILKRELDETIKIS